MTRQLLTLSVVVTIVLSQLVTDVFAGCKRRGGYSRSSRPVVVRPVVVQPVPVVVTARPKQNYPTVPAGSTLTLPANFLGTAPGSVLMVFNNIKLPVKIKQWTQTGVTISLPPMAIRKPVVIRMDIVLPNGTLGHTQRINVLPPAPVVLHPTGPTSPLPTQPALQAARPAQPVTPPVLPAPAVLLLPTKAQPTATAPVASPQTVSGPQAGTPAQPIVLPPVAAPSVPAEEAETFENNPILNEKIDAEEPAESGSTQSPLSSIFNMIGKQLVK